MLYLYKKTNDSLGIEVETYLKDLSAAFRIRESDNDETYLKENEQVIKGEVAIKRYLEFYKGMLTAERSVSADACYIDPETGKTC